MNPIACPLPHPGVPLLEIDHVSQQYGNLAIVRDLSLTLQPGEIGCLLGPSGCGKTTVLRGIAGFEPVTAGLIRLGGTVVSQPGNSLPPEKRRIGMVFQDYALFPHLTVARNITFGLRDMPEAGKRARLAELLAVVGLPEAGSKYPHELSGGQQQRVALARALAPCPALLLLDEPFSSLDVELRERLGQEVRSILKQQHTTALLVTHDQHEAFAIADRIGVMTGGRIEQWDSAYNLYHRPATRFVADFVGEGVFLPGRAMDNGQVETELGTLTCTAPPGCDAGSPVDVLLRPDDIIHDDTSPLQVEILSTAFRGAEILYTLRLPGGSQALALVPSHHDHAIGEHIGIRLGIDHIIAFRRKQ